MVKQFSDSQSFINVYNLPLASSTMHCVHNALKGAGSYTLKPLGLRSVQRAFRFLFMLFATANGPVAEPLKDGRLANGHVSAISPIFPLSPILLVI